jgi:hypothetical protein
MPHGHIWTFKEVDAFIDSNLNATKPLAKVDVLEIKDGTTFVKVYPTAPIKKAMLHFATNEGPWQKRLWETIPATISNDVVSASNDVVSAKLPVGKPIVFYISIIDERDFEVSSNHLTMPLPTVK